MALEMKYFILKPHGTDEYAMASRISMRAYADHIEEIDPVMSKALLAWADAEMEKTVEALRKL